MDADPNLVAKIRAFAGVYRALDDESRAEVVAASVAVRRVIASPKLERLRVVSREVGAYCAAVGLSPTQALAAILPLVASELPELLELLTGSA